MGPTEVIQHIAMHAKAIGQQAGVGAMETAGSIVSFLAAHPKHIEPFLAGEESPLDWPTNWIEHGELTWHAQNGKVVSPAFVRRARQIKELTRSAYHDRSS